MNAERAAKRAGHNLGPRKIKYGGRLNNPHAICKRHPQLGPSRKLQASSAIKKTQLTDRVKKEREKKI